MGNGIDETDDQRALAIERANVLRPLMFRKTDQTPLIAELAHAAETMGVSLSSAKRMFHRLKEGDGRASALEPRGRGPKKGGVRLSPDVEAIIDTNLRDRFLVPECPSFSRIVQEIRLECLNSGVTAPTRRTIKARLDAMDLRDVVRKRQGPKAAREQFSPVAGAFSVDLPLELVQIDHTLADIILVDSIDRKAFRRPWVTFAIDVATRIVTGFYVTFDAPSTLSVALCLEHSALDKAHLSVGKSGCDAWPSRGLPHKIHVDNAKEFHSRAFSQACAEWGIQLDFRPPGRPHYGGHIERLIGTKMGAVHLLPGTTEASPKARGEYDSMGQAVMTLAEFEDWLALEVCRYHQTLHRGLGHTPLATWENLEGETVIRHPNDMDAFRISFYPGEERKIRRDGIHVFGIRYWSDAFGSLIGRLKEAVNVKYDPRDLSKIWVRCPDGRVIEARYRDLQNPKISLWEYREANKALNATRRASTEANLFAYVLEQRRVVERSKRLTRAAKMERERQGQNDKISPSNEPPNPNRMFAIDTGNKNLPTFEVEEIDDSKSPYNKN